MELNVTVSILVLLPITLALVAGGLVLYRRSTRAGWRAVGMGSVALGVGVLLVFTLTLPVTTESELATDSEAPQPIVAREVVSAPSTDAPATSQQPSSLSSSGMMVSRPRSVDELVMRSDLIVVGIITAVVEERWIGPYGDNEKVLPAGDDGMPVTDYEVQVESVLRGDGTVVDGGSVVLRMFGHLSNSSAIITPNGFLLPNLGDYLLFASGENPDGTYGSGPDGLLNVDGESVVYADGVPFGTEVSPDRFVQQIRDAAADAAGSSRLAAPALANEGEEL